MSESDELKRKKALDALHTALEAIAEISTETARDIERVIQWVFPYSDEAFFMSDMQRLSHVMSKQGVTIRIESDDQLKGYKVKLVNVRLVIEDTARPFPIKRTLIM